MITYPNKLSCFFCPFICLSFLLPNFLRLFSILLSIIKYEWRYLTFNEHLLCAVMPKMLCLYYPHCNPVRSSPLLLSQRSSAGYLRDIRKVRIISCCSSKIFDKRGDWNILKILRAVSSLQSPVILWSPSLPLSSLTFTHSEEVGLGVGVSDLDPLESLAESYLQGFRYLLHLFLIPFPTWLVLECPFSLCS